MSNIKDISKGNTGKVEEYGLIYRNGKIWKGYLTYYEPKDTKRITKGEEVFWPNKYSGDLEKCRVKKIVETVVRKTNREAILIYLEGSEQGKA